MKFLLSSWDFQSEKAKAVILSNLPKPICECTVLFIPNEKALPRRLKNGTYVKRLAECGFSEENSYVFDYQHPDLTKNLHVDIVYIGGGNTFATLSRMRETGMDREVIRLVREGAVYVGGSAGVHSLTGVIRTHLKRRLFGTFPLFDFDGRQPACNLKDGNLLKNPFFSGRRVFAERICR